MLDNKDIPWLTYLWFVVGVIVMYHAVEELIRYQQVGQVVSWRGGLILEGEEAVLNLAMYFVFSVVPFALCVSEYRRKLKR